LGWVAIRERGKAKGKHKKSGFVKKSASGSGETQKRFPLMGDMGLGWQERMKETGGKEGGGGGGVPPSTHG